MDQKEYIRTRRVCLKKTNSEQALRACQILQNVNGVEHATPINKNHLTLTYSLESLSFELIEALLIELGFTLDMSILANVRRYYYQYVEDSVLDKLNISTDKHELICCLSNIKSNKPDQYWDQYH